METRYVKTFEQYIESVYNNEEHLDEGLFGGSSIVDLQRKYEAPINSSIPNSDNRMINFFKKGYVFPGWDGKIVKKPKNENDTTAMTAYNTWLNSPSGQAYTKFWKLVEEDGKIDKYQGEIKAAGNVVPGKSIMYVPSMYINYPNEFAAGRSATGAATSGASGSATKDEKAKKALEYVNTHAAKYGVKYAEPVAKTEEVKPAPTSPTPKPTTESLTILKFSDFIKG